MSRTTQHVSYLKLEELSNIFEREFKHISIFNNDNFILKASVSGGFDESYDVGYGNNTQKEITDCIINTIKEIIDPCPDLYQFDLVIIREWDDDFSTDYEFRVFAFL